MMPSAKPGLSSAKSDIAAGGSRLTTRTTLSSPGRRPPCWALAAVLQLDPTKLELFPVGYRNLVYVQQLVGYDLKRDTPGLKGTSI